MNDFIQTDAGKVKNRILAKRIAEAKEAGRNAKRGDKEEMVITEVDKMIIKSKEEGLEQGLEQGKTEGSIDTAKRMIAKGKLSVEEIAEYSDLPVEKIRELAQGA